MSDTADLVHRLLSARTWRAFDVSADGPVLAGDDTSGSVQLVELSPGGGRQTLTALPGACSGRYLKGVSPRTVLVSHDSAGDERAQLSLLRPGEVTDPVGEDGLVPLVHDPAHIHSLAEVLDGGRVVYATNRRNGVDFDLVLLDITTGSETVLYDGGGMVGGAAVAPDGSRALMTRPGTPAMSSQVLLLAGAEAREVTPADEPALFTGLQWLPDSSAAIVTTNSGRDRTGLARLDPDTGALTYLVTDEAHDVTGRLSPDGVRLLVVTDDDGASRLAIHDAATGAHHVDVITPGVGVGDFLTVPRWSADSQGLALTWTSPTVPADVVLVDAATGRSGVVASWADDLEGLELVTPTSVGVPTPDGETVPCFVYSPASPTGSSVLIVHGGPEGQSVRSFSPIVQALAAQGHTVLVPNVRGSVGYGKRWYALDDVELRLDSVADLAAIHDFLPALDLDPARSALWGGSYGGYMVLAGVAFQPEKLGGGRRHRRHLVAGDVPGEHLAVPPRPPRAGVRLPRAQPGVPRVAPRR